MNSTAPSKNVRESLEIIARHVPTSPADAPAEFVRDLAHRWKERGGLVAGKPRHSDRYLDDLLRALGTPIRSLTPKLVGRTNLKPEDAGVLVRLFLSHWHYVGDPSSGEIAGTAAGLYEPLLSDAAIEEVCRHVAERISDSGGEARSGLESKAQSVPGQDTIELIANEFQEADVLFSIGAGQMLLVSQPEGALLGFRDLLTRLWTIDREDDRKRILIWTLDLGRQDFDDLESRRRFMNVQELLIRFKALKRFRESTTVARWSWLQSRTVILLHDTRSVQPEVPRLPTFDPNHVLFSAIPPRWAGAPEFLDLYGHERLQETMYTIFLRRLAEPEAAKSPAKTPAFAPESYTLRYFGHALLNSNEEDKLRGLRLEAPGRSYVEALGTVFVAAAQLLGLQSVPEELSIDGMKIESAHAMEKLRHHGFLPLRLDEFMNF